MSKLTHFDADGRAQMVDVGAKAETSRVAVATGFVEMEPATLDRIRSGTLEKGDVLGLARVAAIQGLKRTSELIPLCHPVRVTGVEIAFHLHQRATENRVEIVATVKAFDRTGVEMEAMTAVAICGLTIYDMCKAIDKKMRISGIQLESKQGGKSGHWTRNP